MGEAKKSYMTQGLHCLTEEKWVNVCFLTDQIDYGYAYLQDKGVNMKDSLEAPKKQRIRKLLR